MFFETTDPAETFQFFIALEALSNDKNLGQVVNKHQRFSVSRIMPFSATRSPSKLKLKQPKLKPETAAVFILPMHKTSTSLLTTILL